MQKTELILVLNCGSSSIKCAVINHITHEKIFECLFQEVGSANSRLKWQKNGNKTEESLPNMHYNEALDYIFNIIKNTPELANITAAGHRVVHGGEYFSDSVVINDLVLAAIKKLAILAPLHNPVHALGIEAITRNFPGLPQVAAFDTAFHQTIPKHAYLYAIPYNLHEEHKIRRYGFHGISHKFVAQKAADILNKPADKCNLITAHLGNGCSICAIKNGHSVDTSMGLTPLDGLVMGTRSGDVDPALHGFLAENLNYDIQQITDMLNKKSGLLGISELSSDMREIETAITQNNKKAELATDVFCYRLAKYIGSYFMILGKIDAIIFTGGIGENSSYIRAKTISYLAMIDFDLDEAKNNRNGKDNNGFITNNSKTPIIVIPTNEELLIAKDTIALTGNK